jgi:hypothetical protein
MSLRAVLAAAMILTTASGHAPASGVETVDIASWISGWPVSYHLSGSKSEPVYLEAVDVIRRGDVFTILGGAPAWAERSLEAIAVESDGRLRHTICPRAMNCDDRSVPSGFLASAALLAASRSGKPLGRADPLPYGARTVLCIPAERIGVVQPVLDPCFDTVTGAVLAQRHRLSGKFDGPSLDPWSIRFDKPDPQATAGP